jgi:hypothetical protein
MPERLSDRLAAGTSRRGFLSRVSGAVMALSGAGAVTSLVEPGDAEAFHFCGHTYTTDSCPHPTALPRIDRKGFPLRAADGHPIDDLGRLIDAGGHPLGEDGRPLTDLDGRPLPIASRTRICDAVADLTGFDTQIDGSWHRCCGGQVRKLVDCCSYNPRRINGDASLTGYCYKGRRVYCVMYYDTKVKC